jgi:rhamnose utilization protein RhaD (predicted bifunctional aldolase and dehydrogenase)
VVDLPATASVEEIVERLPQLHEAYRADYTAYCERGAAAACERGEEPSAIRGIDPAIILGPGVGMFSYGSDKQTHVWPASSTSTPST